MSKTNYLNATEEAGKTFYLSDISGSFIMLNLLSFKEVADYSNFKTIAPKEDITGAEAYQLYIENTLPFLKEAGSEVIFKGKGGQFLIGPESQKWDLVLLVKHKNKETFLKFATNKEYLKIAGHRTAALKDSRLLPITQDTY
ncbi:DUF1330 domain-containing protein [Seonamhaeicola marinus]|uniref:DUF1330 domain-containing protein n=1 Tax=Seonamhaeicola marinus TaxID=1912246 RepID=A0A5D0HJM1_9FLAO|nr:DUF1330 domain-containing protein [Seonamhaeicola marinus]TYA71584.1 DUF1330 domain-containing protein [Seonamhaeicola marinus]